VLVGYIRKNMPGKNNKCQIFCMCHRKGKDCHEIQNEVIRIISSLCHVLYLYS
jgi:hypothetical protein